MRIAGPIALAAALALAACASITPVPPGPYRVGSGQEVTVGRTWSDVSALWSARPKKVRLLSVDGPLLNRLYVSDGLAPGDSLVRAQAKELPTPVVRADMSASERIEFVADSVAALEYQRVETANPRPARFGQAPAVRFDLSARTSEGLDIQGAALVAEHGGKLYVILYLAPAEHYFAAGASEVEAIMASARPLG